MASWKRGDLPPSRFRRGDFGDVDRNSAGRKASIPRPTMIRPARCSMSVKTAAREQRIATQRNDNGRCNNQSTFGDRNRSANALRRQERPAAAPANTALTITSSVNVVRVKSFFKKSSAPEITPVSYPEKQASQHAAIDAAMIQTNLGPRSSECVGRLRKSFLKCSHGFDFLLATGAEFPAAPLPRPPGLNPPLVSRGICLAG